MADTSLTQILDELAGLSFKERLFLSYMAFPFASIFCQQYFENIQIYSKGHQVDKIRIDYNGNVEVYSPFEPYDLTFTGYDLSMTKAIPPKSCAYQGAEGSSPHASVIKATLW